MEEKKEVKIQQETKNVEPKAADTNSAPANDKKIQADNKILITRSEIENINDQIDMSKSKLKSLDDMEEGFTSLSKNIAKCVELLSQSMKGNNVEQKLGAISDNNRIYYLRAMGSIDDERQEAKKKLKELYDQKDEMEKLKKEQLREAEKLSDKIDDKAKKKEETEEERKERQSKEEIGKIM